MRTSNKILLGAFITVIAVLTIIHVTLYAKMKSGHAIAYVPDAQPDRFDNHQLSAKTYVSARGLKNLRITSSQTPLLKIQKQNDNSISFSQSGDSLILNAGNNLSSESRSGRQVGSEEVILSLPGIQGLVMEDCNVVITGEQTVENARSFSIAAYNSNISIGDEFGESGNNFFAQLKIDGVNNTILRLLNQTTVAELEINLRDRGVLIDEGFKSSILRGTFDNSTDIKLKGENLNKLNQLKK